MKWDIVEVGALRVVTGEGVEETLTPKQHVLRALKFDAAATAEDVRPTLVYFHWPHDEGERGANADKSEHLCGRVLDQETVARWGLLFRCVQVDMGTSETKFTSLVGSRDKPSFALLDHEGTVVTEITKPPKSSTKFVKQIESAITKFPTYWKGLKKQLAEQPRLMKQAKAHEKAERYEEALELVDEIRFSDVRVGPEYDKAQAYGLVLDQKLAASEG